jgi:hypothetical protein
VLQETDTECKGTEFDTIRVFVLAHTVHSQFTKRVVRSIFDQAKCPRRVRVTVAYPKNQKRFNTRKRDLFLREMIEEMTEYGRQGKYGLDFLESIKFVPYPIRAPKGQTKTADVPSDAAVLAFLLHSGRP